MVSVIIPYTNKDKVIGKCIASIWNSTYKNIEIIQVNEGFERSAQRNIGIERSKGEYIMLVDSDWIVTPHLIEECVGLMDKYDAIYIPEQIITKGPFAKIRNWERQFYTGTPIDVVRFVKRECCPYFDESMSGPEDSDFDRKVIGKRFISKNVYYHLDNVGMIDWFKKKAYYSKSMDKFEKKNKGDKILNLKWRCWTVFMEDFKWRKFLSNPLMAICVMLMLAIRGIIYKINK